MIIKYIYDVIITLMLFNICIIYYKNIQYIYYIIMKVNKHLNNDISMLLL